MLAGKRRLRMVDFRWTGILVAAVVIGAWAGNWATDVLAQDAAETVTQQLVDDQFVPAELHFRSGVLYRLHLENHGREMHEFTAPDFLKSVDVKNPEILVRDGTDVVLQPGDVKDVLFVPRRPGRFKLICADHDWAGMVGDIVVE
jgi:uncharacterized cupredoxin-like copper-binding protein